MIAVSNTTPLHYLVLVDVEEILPRLFDRIVVPGAVLAEMSHERAPARVREWAAHPPTWLQIAAPLHIRHAG